MNEVSNYVKDLDAKRETRKILSPAAIKYIKDGLKDGLFKGDPDARELAFMLPSTKPESYSKVRGTFPSSKTYTHNSQWCSYCYDFTSLLLCCVGCRGGVCSATTISNRGCAYWNEAIEHPDFIFCCLRCSIKLKLRCEASVPHAMYHQTLIPYRSGSRTQTVCPSGGRCFSVATLLFWS